MRGQGAGAPGWYIRAAGLGDLPQILAIEETSHSDPWGVDAFMSELRDSVHSHFWVGVSLAPQAETVLGYICFRFLADEIYIVNITVAPDARGMGIGGGILAAAIEWGKAKGAERAVLDVRGDNERALGLYRKVGFRAARPNVPPGVPIVMVLPLSKRGL